MFARNGHFVHLQEGSMKSEKLAIEADVDDQDNISIAGNDVAPLVSPKENEIIVKKVISTGVNYLLQAVNTTGNTLIFVKMLDLGSAGSLGASIQSFFRNVLSGGLVSAGQILKEALGDDPIILSDTTLTDDERASREIRVARAKEIVVVSYALTGLLTVVSMGAYGACYFVLPRFKYTPEVADATSWFLLISGLATYPILALNMIGQIAFIRDHWKTPLLFSFMNRIPALIFAGLFVYYHLFSPALDGSKQIGLGNAIAPWASYIGMEIVMRVQDEFCFMPSFKEFFTILRKNLNEIDEIAKNGHSKLRNDFSAMFVLWLLMCLQRFTEWGNLVAVNMALEKLGTEGLEAINASMPMISILCMLYQGIGTAGNLCMASDTKTLRSEKQPFEKKEEAFNHIKSISIKSLLSGFAISLVSAAGLFLTRKYIIDLFMDHLNAKSTNNNSISQSLTLENNDGFLKKSTAETLLMITVVGLIFDALRIISSNLLNAWYNKNEKGSGLKTIVWPNVVSLISMTAFAIPAAYVSGQDRDDQDKLILMFGFRTAMILVAAAINMFQLFKIIEHDKKSYIEIEDQIQVDTDDQPPSQATVPMSSRRESGISDEEGDQSATAIANFWRPFKSKNASSNKETENQSGWRNWFTSKFCA